MILLTRFKKNNYLFLATEISDSGGIEIFSKYLIESLMDQRENIHLTAILLNNSDLPNIKTVRNDFNCICCGHKVRLLSRVKFLFNSLLYFFLKRPKVVIANHINLSPICLFLNKISNTPYITIIYGVEVWNIPSALKRKSLEDSTVVASFSNYTSSQIQKNFNIKNKIFYFPPTVDFEKFFIKEKSQLLTKKHGIEENCKVILTVARLSYSERQKGYDKVIEAMPQITNRVKDVKYLLVGHGDKKEMKRIEELIRKNNLEDRVILTGHVSNLELADYYNLCDVFVMPSKQEGFGIVFLEALACGKPVIAGNKDGSRDAVLDGQLGLLVDPDNVEEIAGVIMNVLSGNVDKHLLDGEYLRSKVIEHYGYDVFCQRVAKIFRHVEG